MTAQFATHRLRTRNRFFRVVLSRHVRDLKLIALLAAAMVTIIIVFWGNMLLIPTTNTDALDQILQDFYNKLACLEQHSTSAATSPAGQLEKQMDQLERARNELVAARSKIQQVDQHLWKYIEQPAQLLRSTTATITCADDLTTPPRNLSVPILVSHVKLLTSALAYTGSTFSVWAVVGLFGTVFLTFSGWLYRTGDTRMTAIDVVASEIFSLCRAITNNRSVKGFATYYASDKPPYALSYLELEEEYHDFMQVVGQNLGFLDQSSIARITGFYTSLKILRDRIRMLKNWAADASCDRPSAAAGGNEFWRYTMKQAMYDLFLCLENGRIALHLLLEGDDLHDDSIFVTMMSEIRAFVFLKQVNDNSTYIGRRLEARLAPPVFKTHEELESYLHPAYRAPLQKMCANYHDFYEDDVGKKIIEKLRAATGGTDGTAPTPRRADRKIVRVHRSRVRAAAARAAALSALLLLFGLAHADIAAAEPANACTANSGPDILAAVAGSNIPRVQAVPSFNLAPIGGPTAIGLRRTFEPKDPKDKIDNYRVIVQFGAKPKPENTAFADGLQVSAIEPSETSPLRASGYIGQHDTLLELTTPVPGISRGLRGWGWHDGLITVVACSNKQPVFIAAFPTVFSDRLTCIVMTGFVTIVIYLAVSKAVSTWDNKPRPGDGKIKWQRYLDPVMMSSGPNGKGSLSRLQVLFFTILLFFVLLYIVLRVGFLSDMSPTVLLLLGISGIGAAASKAADVGLNRIDFSNWVWMIGKGWLPANGPASVTVASWRDIVTADDGFDVYHFQMLIFSLVVGVALLQVGFTDLSTFRVPEALLAVLGLSQAVYVGGKLVSSPAPGDLDKAVTELRTRETNFVKAVISNTAASATAASDLTQARARAPTEFSAYGEQQELVKGMFKSVFGDFQPGATFDPRFR